MADIVSLVPRRSKSVKMPRSIKIGHRRFEIVAWDKRAAASENARGDCREDPPVIRISKGLSRPDQAEVMLHEVFHACWRRVPSTGVDEETAVGVLSENFCQVWADNAQLVAWISECLR